ncbi:MAG: bifunctional adenosylcobinamide kinase/adenosylcobinamide-phosphate guanylyltransferase [Alphaproteobacteria bacterium]|nr:bifunctional adenosylcobinamide kinase/adenosylcobinamide-phosphate guanylyltransferase [Alphaproteobacteria bacterium]
MTEDVPFKNCLILGGARSGKTRRALSLAETSGKTPIYIATAQAFDDEMQERIDLHKAERGPNWRTIEASLELPAAITAASTPDSILLIDCLTLWLSNLTFAERDITVETQHLIQSLKDAAGPVLVVSNEVGLGIVPDNALARRFRDEQGRLNQSIAAAVDRVEFIAAGLSLTLKG